jgi:hypothetical protein
MAINVTKPAINLREKLNEVTLETGIKGEELLNSDTSTEARNVLELDTHLFTDFESTGIDDNATSTAITIDASENVGVGTTTPTAQLHLSSTIGQELLLQSTNVNSNPQLAILNDVTKWVIRNDGSDGDKLIFRGNASGAYLTDLALDGVTGDVTVNTGNLVIGTSGKGIDFSATSDGSGTMTSEVLDDYEEGTWTATVQTGSGSGTKEGRYTKIGRMVYIDLHNMGGEMSGNCSAIGGLPFATGTGPTNGAFAGVITGDVYIPTSVQGVNIRAEGSVIHIEKDAAAYTIDLGTVHTVRYCFSICYRVSG